MAIKVCGCTVIDDSKNVCANTVTACCVIAESTVTIPSGTTACRPTGATGSLYFDTDEGSLVAHNGTDWAAVGGAGGVEGIDLTEAVAEACDAFGIATFTYCCCRTGCFMSAYNCLCYCGWFFNHTESPLITNMRIGVFGCVGNQYCHFFCLLSPSGSLIGANACGIDCGNFDQTKRCLAPFRNGRFTCCWQRVPRANWHITNSGALILSNTESKPFPNLYCNACAILTGTSYKEYIINEKGGVTFTDSSALAATCTACSGTQITANQYPSTVVYGDSPYGTIPNIPGALFCYTTAAKCVGNAVFTVCTPKAQSGLGNTSFEVCDFAYIAQSTSFSYHQCHFASLSTKCVRPWFVGSCATSLTGRYGSLVGRCEDNPTLGCLHHKQILFPKKIGYNALKPESYDILSVSSTNASIYKTCHCACGAWVVSFRSNIGNGTSECWCGVPRDTITIPSRDGRYIHYIRSLGGSLCCYCTHPFVCICRSGCSLTCIQYFTNRNLELHVLDLCCGTRNVGKFCNANTDIIACIASECLCTPCHIQDVTPFCIVNFVNKIGNSASGSFGSSALPTAFAQSSVFGGDGYWSCNNCFYYIPTCLGEYSQEWTVYDMCQCRVVCSVDFMCLLRYALSAVPGKTLYSLCQSICYNCFIHPCSIALTGCCVFWCGIGMPDSHPCDAQCLRVKAPATDYCGTLSNTLSVSSYINPTNDHLVTAALLYSNTLCSNCRKVNWVGWVCYDLNNHCISKVHTLYPTESARKDRGCRQPPTVYDYSNFSANPCLCGDCDQRLVSRLWGNPDATDFGISFMHHNMRIGNRGASDLDEICTSGTSCLAAGNIWGCLCYGLCCTNWTNQFGINLEFYRIPMDKPMECAGVNVDSGALTFMQSVTGTGGIADFLYSCINSLCTIVDCQKVVKNKIFSFGGACTLMGCCRDNPNFSTYICDHACQYWCICDQPTCCRCLQMCTHPWGVILETCIYKGISNRTFGGDPASTVFFSGCQAQPCVEVSCLLGTTGPRFWHISPACGDCSGAYSRLCRFVKRCLYNIV